MVFPGRALPIVFCGMAFPWVPEAVAPLAAAFLASSFSFFFRASMTRSMAAR